MPKTLLYKTVVITYIRQETEGVKTFTLTYEDGSAIPYTAGQFITFVFNHHNKEERRSFSISSSPALNEPLAITIKRIDNGAYSRLLNDRALVGDKLQITGAAGLFTIPDTIDDYKQVFFFAAGIGITPILSIIKTLLHTNTQQVVLIYSSRTVEEVVFYNELIALQQNFPDNFKIEFLYSTSFDLSRARLNRSLLPQLLREHAAVPYDKMLFYLCGPFAYMRMAIWSIEEQGIHSDQIKRENFNTNDRAVRQVESPDKSTHNVTIKHNGQTHTITIPYTETILHAAKRNGITLPYSCEAGRCGSCAALCTSGEIWLSYNEVLMNADLRKGMVLTCVGHPINGDATIEF